MSQINIAVLVDADNLVNHLNTGTLQPGSLNSPTSLGAWGGSDNYIYMVGKRGVVSNDQQAKSELQIDASSGDEITWTMSTFASNTTYSAFIYDSQFNLTKGSAPMGIEDIAYHNIEAGVLLPPSSNPEAPKSQYVNHVYRTSAKVTQIDQTIQYTMSFQLVEAASGNVLGYFVWDPFIVVPF